MGVFPTISCFVDMAWNLFCLLGDTCCTNSKDLLRHPKEVHVPKPFLLYKHQCFTGISATEKSHIFSHVKIRYFYLQKYQPHVKIRYFYMIVKISANQKSSFVAMFLCLGMDNSGVYIINRIIHGRLKIIMEYIFSCSHLISHLFNINVNTRR